MFRQDAAGEWFDLAEGDSLEAASALQTKGKSAYSAEKIEYAHFVGHTVTP